MITARQYLELGKHDTPFYVYDMDLLEQTLKELNEAASVNSRFKVHYAMKACSVTPVLKAIRSYGLGVDTVSGGEIQKAVEAGFAPSSILFAGVGKSRQEIDLALNYGIDMFNVESLPELVFISERALALKKIAGVSLRVNPDIDAHTHHYITTGLSENKFGINMSQLDSAVGMALSLEGIELRGLHFHIGSQITIDEPFVLLCEKINKLVENLRRKEVFLTTINVGGGLGIDYDNPDENPIPDFKRFFNIFDKHLDMTHLKNVYFELGRALVGQCGSLVSKVLYFKEGETRKFVILDAGMNNLIRPALYEARHAIENVSGLVRGTSKITADVVGPVCETADEFGKDYEIAEPLQGDVVVIKSAGAYGQVMSSHYNERPLFPPKIVRNNEK